MSQPSSNQQQGSGAQAPSQLPGVLLQAVDMAEASGVELSPKELVSLARVIAEDRKALALERIATCIEDHNKL
jgi:hypothetical protein